MAGAGCVPHDVVLHLAAHLRVDEDLTDAGPAEQHRLRLDVHVDDRVVVVLLRGERCRAADKPGVDRDETVDEHVVRDDMAAVRDRGVVGQPERAALATLQKRVIFHNERVAGQAHLIVRAAREAVVQDRVAVAEEDEERPSRMPPRMTVFRW